MLRRPSVATRRGWVLANWNARPLSSRVRTAKSRMSAASVTRAHTIIEASKLSSAILISRYEPPQIADRPRNIASCLGVTAYDSIPAASSASG